MSDSDDRSGGSKRIHNKDLYERMGTMEVDLGSFKAEVRTGFKSLTNVVEALGAKLDSATKPTDQRWLVGVILFLAGTAVTLTQCSQAKAIADARQQGKSDEAFRQLEVRTSGWERNHKAALESTKELLQQSIQDVEHRVTNGPMSAIRAEMDGLGERILANERDLKSRAGMRWNKPDQVEFEVRLTRDLDEIRRHIETIRGTRFTREDALRELQQVNSRLTQLEDEDYGRPEAEKDLAEIRTWMRRIESQLEAHEKSEGHPTLSAKIEAISSRMDAVSADVERLRRARELPGPSGE